MLRALLRTLFLLAGMMLVLQPVTAQTLPKTPIPAQKMLAVDISQEPNEVKLLVHVLQGLVNRTTPSLYVINEQYEGGADEALAAQIQDWGRQTLEKNGIEFRQVQSWTELLAIFKTSYRGGMLYDTNVWNDPNRAHVVNGMITECAVNDLLPVTTAMNEELDLQIHGSVEGRWPSVNDFIYWAGSKLPALQQVNRQAILHKHPWSFHGVDYAVANRLLVLWVEKGTFESDRGRRRLSRALAQTPPNTAVLGSWQSAWPKPQPGTEGLDQPTLLKYLSDQGKFFVPIASPGNFSVHSGFRIEALKQKEVKFRPLERDKAYVTFVLSGGENLSAFSLIRPLLWNQKERGSVPLGWTFSPALFDLAPAMLKGFYETATPNDYFVTADSGYGQIRLGYGSQTTSGTAILDAFLQLTAESMQRADSREIWVASIDEATLQHYVEKLPSLTGIFTDSEAEEKEAQKSVTLIPRDGGPAVRPVFHAFALPALDLKSEEQLTSAAEQITTRAGNEPRPRFIFVGLNALQTGPKQAAELAKRLPKDYILVRPDEFLHLAKESLKRE